MPSHQRTQVHFTLTSLQALSVFFILSIIFSLRCVFIVRSALVDKIIFVAGSLLRLTHP